MVHQEPNHRTPYDTAVPLMGRYPRVMKKTKILYTTLVYTYS